MPTKWSTAQKMKFSIKVFFSKCDQIHSSQRIWSYLLKKSLMESFKFLCSGQMTKWKWQHFILFLWDIAVKKTLRNFVVYGFRGFLKNKTFLDEFQFSWSFSRMYVIGYDFFGSFLVKSAQPSRHLHVQSQQWKHQEKILTMFKVSFLLTLNTFY